MGGLVTYMIKRLMNDGIGGGYIKVAFINGKVLCSFMEDNIQNRNVVFLSQKGPNHTTNFLFYEKMR